MTRGDPVVGRFALGIPTLRTVRAVQKVVRDALKGGDDNDRRAAVHRIPDDSSDVADAIGCGERRSAEFKHSHAAEPSELSACFAAGLGAKYRLKLRKGVSRSLQDNAASA